MSLCETWGSEQQVLTGVLGGFKAFQLGRVPNSAWHLVSPVCREYIYMVTGPGTEEEFSPCASVDMTSNQSVLPAGPLTVSEGRDTRLDAEVLTVFP